MKTSIPELGLRFRTEPLRFGGTTGGVGARVRSSHNLRRYENGGVVALQLSRFARVPCFPRPFLPETHPETERISSHPVSGSPETPFGGHLFGGLAFLTHEQVQSSVQPYFSGKRLRSQSFGVQIFIVCRSCPRPTHHWQQLHVTPE